MIPKSREIAKVSWILFAVTIFNLIYCDSAAEQRSDGKRKYLEVDDLKGYDDPLRRHISDEEMVDLYEDAATSQLSKKIERRSPRVDAAKKNAQPIQSTKTSKPQSKKQRPGFFWTLVRVTFETFNDTRSAIQQISQIINESIPNESIIKKQNLASLKMKATTAPGIEIESEIPTTTTTTTEEPEFKLTRPLLLSLIRRNVNGLVRLFNIEWRDAINQSQKNLKEFQVDLGKQVGMYLQDNPINY